MENSDESGNEFSNWAHCPIFVNMPWIGFLQIAQAPRRSYI
jgi:hypothetical protein